MKSRSQGCVAACQSASACRVVVCLQSDQLSGLHSKLLSEQQRITALKGEVKAKAAVIAELVGVGLHSWAERYHYAFRFSS